MVKIVYGAKGSGKTKRIIDMANESIESVAGNIVFITDTNRYMFDVKYQIRALNVTEHKIFDEEALIGFIKGLIAGNHDISLIYIDGAHRIAKKDMSEMQSFYDALEEISQNQKVDFVVCVSSDLPEMPEFLKKYL